MPNDDKQVDDKQVTAALWECELFSSLKRDELALIQKIAKTHSVKAAATIFMLGEEASTLYVIAEGDIALMLPLAIRGHATEITVEQKQAGDVIAWSALVPPHKLTFSARAKEPTTLVGIRRDDLEAVFTEHPSIKATTMGNLCRVIGSRVALLEALMMRDLQRWVEDRSRR